MSRLGQNSTGRGRGAITTSSSTGATGIPSGASPFAAARGRGTAATTPSFLSKPASPATGGTSPFAAGRGRGTASVGRGTAQVSQEAGKQPEQKKRVISTSGPMTSSSEYNAPKILLSASGEEVDWDTMQPIQRKAIEKSSEVDLDTISSFVNDIEYELDDDIMQMIAAEQRPDAMMTVDYIAPVRCMIGSCGLVIEPTYRQWIKLIDPIGPHKLTIKQAFEKLGVKSHCCRLSIMSPIMVNQIEARYDHAAAIGVKSPHGFSREVLEQVSDLKRAYLERLTPETLNEIPTRVSAMNQGFHTQSNTEYYRGMETVWSASWRDEWMKKRPKQQIEDRTPVSAAIERLKGLSLTKEAEQPMRTQFGIELPPNTRVTRILRVGGSLGYNSFIPEITRRIPTTPPEIRRHDDDDEQ